MNEIAIDERGKPFRIGYQFAMAEKHHRGCYECKLYKSGEMNIDPESGERTEEFARFEYCVRVKGKPKAV